MESSTKPTPLIILTAKNKSKAALYYRSHLLLVQHHLKGGVVIPASPGIRRIARHHSDKSEAGGDVVLGGFLVAIIAVVLCYIRVTRPNQTQDA
ncbi:hypothetical protein DKX38_005460 [Salix brachista]|uniref:Uncharacterized protein n=1 Tax=Salix brachista TaxID=2182728 RepID=A0A5N5N1P0_9ROSI|nr:hypothetical protein DKX38_005460 [Salix brachista]